ncbi:TolC family protein [Flavitalea sp.]|nr:TolC family protein [Flavitalea sp.]
MKPYPLTKISKLLTLLLLAAVSSEKLSAQQQQADSLGPFALSAKESVDYAMKNNVQVKNALIGINIQEQTNREITSAAYPQVTGSVGLTDFLKIPVNLLPGELAGQPAGTFIPVQFGTKWSGNYGVNATQMLFDGQVFVGLQARKAAMTYARQNAEVTNELIKANVYKIYYSLIVSKKQMEVIDVNIDRAKKLLEDTRALYKNGFAENLDIDKVNVNVSNLQTEKIKLRNQVEAGYVGLKYLMGMPVNSQLTLTDSVTEDQIKKDVLDESSFKFEDRKEFQLVQTAQKLGEFNIKRYRAQYIPTVSLTGNYTRNAYRTDFNYFKSGDGYPWFATAFIGVSINIPIFDGFAKDARIKKARYELLQTKNNVADTKNNIVNEIETAKINMRSAVVTIDEQRKNMELAERVYNQTKIKYEQGLGSNLEIITAESDLKIAQNNYFSAMYDAVIAKIDYLKATGKL